MHYLEKALFKAIKADNPGDVKRLIKAIDKSSKSSRSDKASLTACIDQQSCLHYALEQGAYDAFNILFPYFQFEDELILSCDKNHRSLFWWAVARGRIDYAKKILPYYQKKQLTSSEWLKPDNKGVSPMHWAAQSSDDTILQWLLSLIPSKSKVVDIVNQVDEGCNTPLHKACIYKKRQNIILLLNAGSAIDGKNNDNKSFIDYLESDNSIFSTAQVNNGLKRKLLNQINLELIADPDNQSLINLYKKLSQQVSLLETVRYEINLNMKIDGKLDSLVEDVLNPNKNKRVKEIYCLIGKDKSSLKNYSDQIKNHVSKLEIMLKRWKHSGDILVTTGWTLPTSTIIALPVILTFGFLFYVTMFSSKYVPLSIASSMFFATPFFIAIICISSVAIVGGLVMLGIGAYQIYKINQALEVEMTALLSEAKAILTKLDIIEKSDPNQLPVNFQKIQELKSLIAIIENMQYKRSVSADVNDAINLLHSLDASIVDISRAIMASKKPISAMSATEVEEEVDVINLVNLKPVNQSSVLNDASKQLETIDVSASTSPTSQSPLSFWMSNFQAIKSSKAEIRDNVFQNENGEEDIPLLKKA